jgi:tRNA(Ile2) C34 agmatinyltransferase TiaS
MIDSLTKKAVSLAVKGLDKLSFKLRRWVAIKERGECPRCGGYLTEYSSNMFRCIHCKRD